MTATDKETLEQKLRAELEKASFIVVAHYMATNFDKLFAEAVMVVIRPYIDHLTADLKDRDTQIGLLQAGDEWARKDYEALKSENTKQREMLERAHEGLADYADKSMWLGHKLEQTIWGITNVFPITYVWRGYQGDTEQNHPADSAIETLSVLEGQKPLLKQSRNDLAAMLRKYLLAQSRMLDNWADGDDAVKAELWRSLHSLEDEARETLASLSQVTAPLTPEKEG